MYKYKVILAYDGTSYGGWQIQHNAVSIQSLVEKALSTALRTPTAAIASGRTDAGVHARGQVAHFMTIQPVDLPRLHHSINGLLPPDIRILHVEETAMEFHARYSALSKEYHYHFHLNPVMDPFKRLYALHVRTPLDLPAIIKATHYFVGTHDFTTFANVGGTQDDTVRTLSRLTVEHETGGIRLEFEGNGFLYKMVRNITGALLAIGQGKLSSEAIPLLLKAEDRKLAPAAVPPQGLFLVNVRYQIE